ncbi:MAG: hypothetical protein L0Y54_04550 [Sporichthyaceae bacterium]|nr:hypothetical protein [Sporichthyaceae bacterium]
MNALEGRLQRIGGACGLLFLISLYIGFLADTGDVDPVTASRADVAEFMAQHATNTFSRFMIGISAVFLVWFVAALAERIRTAAGRGVLGTTVLGGGLLWAGLILTGSAGYLSTQFPQLRQVSEETANAMWATQLAPGLTMGLAQAVVYSAVAIAALAARALPRWIGWLSAALAVLATASVLDPLTRDGLPAIAGVLAWALGIVWVIATSMALITTGAARVEATASASPSPATP